LACNRKTCNRRFERIEKHSDEVVIVILIVILVPNFFMELYQPDFRILLIILIVAGIFLIPVIFFYITQQNLLKAIKPENRLMSPGEVWLQLIPVFGLVWQFIVVTRISDSIRREITVSDFSFEQQAYQPFTNGERPAYNIGISYCILFCCGIIPCVGVFCTLAGIVCWIIYWIKINEFKTQILHKNLNSYYPPSTPLPGDYNSGTL
jgi:hypothetical protein